MKKWAFFLPAAATLLLAAALYASAVALLPVSEQNRLADLNETLTTLLPGSSQFSVEPYSGEDGTIVAAYRGETGYVVETVTAGYAGDITLLVGVDDGGTVTGVVVRDLQETFGLGRRAMVDVPFLTQLLFDYDTLTVGENVDALTGATVTSKALVRAVNAAKAFVTGADISSGATTWGG